MWFNTRYAKTLYGFFAPFDHNNGCAAVTLPATTPEELDRYFARFLDEAGITGRVTLEFKTEGYPIGICTARQIDNVLFAGNAGGFIDPSFGFGQFNSIASGIMAGTAIARGFDYEELVRPHVARIRRFLSIRKFLNRLDDGDFDRLVWLAGRYPCRKAAFDTRLDWFGLIGRLLGLFFAEGGDEGKY